MNNAVKYFKDAKKELSRVAWPDWPKVAETSLVVGACTAVFACYLWIVDIGISQVFSVFFYKD